MLPFTITLGGLLLMMGHHSREESLFYYFRLEDQVPENHLLRLIDRHVNFEFIRAKLKDSYSDGGRPSIDPELLLRMLLVGYLYGITSERKLVEELRMHLAWRWFTGLGFDQEVPHHSTFSKNRHGRFQESNVFQELFEEIVARCVAAGLVKGEHMSVDGSFIQANADHHSRVPREQLVEVAKVNHTVREYLVELERENPVEAPVPQQEKVSTTDPDSTYATKSGPARLGYYDNYLVDNASCVIVGVQATPARLSQESAAARDMIERYRERYGYLPQTLAADTTYGNGEMLQWLDDRGIAAYIRVKENPNGPTDLYGIDQFTYVPEENCYICPEGKPLKYVGINPLNRTHLYYSTIKRCRECSQKSRCTRGKYRTLARCRAASQVWMGDGPYGGLVMDAHGSLYGTTSSGGTLGAGTVFKLDLAGSKTVLYNFGGPDGQYPRGSLIRDGAGNLYGITFFGGAYDKGTVFKLDSAGAETVLHSFSGGADGGLPTAGVIGDAAGNLYGTTSDGGVHFYGTIFALDPIGNLTVLYSFRDGPDGGRPFAGLLRTAGGALYGVTAIGGPYEYGTVFRVTP